MTQCKVGRAGSPLEALDSGEAGGAALCRTLFDRQPRADRCGNCADQAEQRNPLHETPIKDRQRCQNCDAIADQRRSDRGGKPRSNQEQVHQGAYQRRNNADQVAPQHQFVDLRIIRDCPDLDGNERGKRDNGKAGKETNENQKPLHLIAALLGLSGRLGPGDATLAAADGAWRRVEPSTEAGWLHHRRKAGAVAGLALHFSRSGLDHLVTQTF